MARPALSAVADPRIHPPLRRSGLGRGQTASTDPVIVRRRIVGRRAGGSWTRRSDARCTA